MNSKSVRIGVLACAFAIFLDHAYAQDPTGVVPKDSRQEIFDHPSVGVIHVLIPKVIKSFAIFIDGDGGWNDGINDMAQLLANQGALVAGVDTVPYLKSLDLPDRSCASPAEDFEDLSRIVSKRYSLEASMKPALIGYSSGATLAYAVLAQSKTHMFRGAMTLGFCDTLEIQRPLCKGSDLALRHSKEGLVLFPAKNLNAPWFALQGEIDQACTVKEVAEFVEPISRAKLISLPKVGHGFAVARRWQPQYVRAYKELAAAK